MIQKDFGVTKKVITTRNPQANSSIEHVHQTMGNMIQLFELNKSTEKDPLDSVLAAGKFCSMNESTYCATSYVDTTRVWVGCNT